MAVNMKLVEKTYNTIYDYLINKCDNKEFYKAMLNHDIKSTSKSSIYFNTNELYNVMIELQEAIKKHVAEEKGTGNLRKAMLNVLKRTNESRPLLQKAYVEDGWTMVCDSWVLIRVKRDVDIPKHDKDVEWLNWKGLIPKDLSDRQEVLIPSIKALKEHIKINANEERYISRYCGKKTVFYDIIDYDTNEILTRINTQYLRDVLEALDDTKTRCYIGKGNKSRTSAVYFENTDGECAIVCPMRVE